MTKNNQKNNQRPRGIIPAAMLASLLLIEPLLNIFQDLPFQILTSSILGFIIIILYTRAGKPALGIKAATIMLAVQAIAGGIGAKIGTPSYLPEVIMLVALWLYLQKKDDFRITPKQGIILFCAAQGIFALATISWLIIYSGRMELVESLEISISRYFCLALFGTMGFQIINHLIRTVEDSEKDQNISEGKFKDLPPKRKDHEKSGIETCWYVY